MRKTFLALAACSFLCLFSTKASATANFVYHEQTNNFVATPVDDSSPGCSGGGTNTSCGRYVENTDRDASPGFQIYSPETYTLHFKIEFQFYTNEVRVYYTTDGSQPCGVKGAVGNVTQLNGTPCGASNTTQVAVASYTCTYSDVSQSCQIVDVATGSIPPQPGGTTVRYIVSAWHSGGGDEIFANSGACGGCFSATSSSDATVFQYNVLARPATPLVISEFRLRGTAGPDDEFVEIYNNSNSDVTVNAFDGSAGFSLAASDGVARFTIPNGAVIPARGHYLGVNSAGYSLASYPAAGPSTGGNNAGATGAPTVAASANEIKRAVMTRGVTARGSASAAKGARSPGIVRPAEPRDAVPGPSAATGDAVYTTGIADNAGIALFSTANPANFISGNRLDAVGSTAEANTLYKEGAGYPAVIVFNSNFSFYRDLCAYAGVCTTPGTPKDTGDNASDFLFVETAGTDLGAGRRIGAPGPENSTSPIQRNASFSFNNLDRTVSSAAMPNRDRNFTPDPMNNSMLGTMTIRKRVTNNTAANVTRLRFRIIELTIYDSPADLADLRVRSSSTELVTGVNDPATCGLLPTPCAVTVQGLTLEQASAPNDQPNGGGYNSSLAAGNVALATPLAPGASINVNFLLGVMRTGRFRFYLNIEALP